MLKLPSSVYDYDVINHSWFFILKIDGSLATSFYRFYVLEKQNSIYKEKHHQYGVFTNIFRMVLDKHAPIKKKIVRYNEAPFMTKKLSKAIMNRSKLKNNKMAFS